jgi:hypothetical protein
MEKKLILAMMKKILQTVKISLVLIFAIFYNACSDNSYSSDSPGPGTSTDGTGGSMARFTITGDMLYTVSIDKLKQFNISNPANPKYTDLRDQNIGSNIETIFPMDTLLYIGSQAGMYIYDIRNPNFPTKLGEINHIRSCDPVVVEGHYAYVTLNTNYSWCGTSPNNVLMVYDVQDQLKPVPLRQINLNGPQGLGADGDLLFVCDKGLKVFNISTPENPETIAQIGDLAYMDEAEYVRSAYDVIPIGGVLMLVAGEGLFLFDYSDFSTTHELQFLSKIDINKE